MGQVGGAHTMRALGPQSMYHFYYFVDLFIARPGAGAPPAAAGAPTTTSCVRRPIQLTRRARARPYETMARGRRARQQGRAHKRAWPGAVSHTRPPTAGQMSRGQTRAPANRPDRRARPPPRHAHAPARHARAPPNLARRPAHN